MKPFIKIGLIIFILIVAGLIVYFVWSALVAPPPEIPAPPVSNVSNLPTAPLEGEGEINQLPGEPSPTQVIPALAKISENPVFDYWVDSQTREVYYLNPEGQIFSAKNGEDLQITQQKLNAPNFIELSGNGQRVLAAFGDPRLPQWGIFDVIDRAWRPLPDGILNATWGENSNTLIGFVKNGSNINLSTINLSQGQPVYKVIAKDLRLQDVKITFSPPNGVIIQERPSVNYPVRVWRMSIKDLSFHSLFSPENGLTIKLSGDKTTLLAFSNSNGFRILNADTLGLVSPVPFSTLPAKCSPDSAVIYCFVPSDDNFKKASLPDDYLEQKFFTSDSLYKIDLITDEVAPVAIPQNAALGPIDAKNPLVNGGKLYFINQYDNSIYALSFGLGQDGILGD